MNVGRPDLSGTKGGPAPLDSSLETRCAEARELAIRIEELLATVTSSGSDAGRRDVRLAHALAGSLVDQLRVCRRRAT